MSKIEILFVDDDDHILAGLRRLTRARKDDWEASFSSGGDAALALMTSRHFDVVVSDMRMPGMDGAAFLDIVRQRYPETIRVILSGYADSEAVMRTVGPAHAYLAKPCQPDQLMAAIDRPLALRRLLSSESLRSALAGLTNLPTPSALYDRLSDELRSPGVSAASVANIISRDVAMTAELLKLTNSAYFSISAKAATPLQAVRTLGLNTVEALILRIGIFRQLDRTQGTSAMVETLNDHSLRLAALAEEIALANGCDAITAKLAFCAGMLCSLGALVFLDSRPHDYPAALAATRDGTRLAQVETDLFGASHALVGAYLLGLWGFSDLVVEAVAHADLPSAAPHHSGSENVILTALHAARALGPRFPLLPDGAKSQPPLDMRYVVDVRKDLTVTEWRRLAAGYQGECLHA